MVSRDNFTTFSLIFSTQILSEVRQNSESFEGFLSGRNIFLNLCWGHPSGQFVIFFYFLAFPYWLKFQQKDESL